MKKSLVVFVLFFISIGNYLNTFSYLSDSIETNQNLVSKYKSNFGNLLSKKFENFPLEKLEVLEGKIDAFISKYNLSMKSGDKKTDFLSQLVALKELVKETRDAKANSAILSNLLGDIQTQYPGCDSPDITVGNYTISACNIGTNKSGTGEKSYGSYFQWGRNKGFSYTDKSSQLSLIDGNINTTKDTFGFVQVKEQVLFSDEAAWSMNDYISDNWGDITNTSESRKGPCAVGYHIPSNLEWSGIINDGGWENGMELSNFLKIPFAGFRHWHDGAMYEQSQSDRSLYDTFMYEKSLGGYYWSSSHGYLYDNQVGNVAYSLNFNSAIIDSKIKNPPAFGFPVRCFKN